MKSLVCLLGAVVACSASAQADTVVTFRYDSLSTSFSSATGAFDAHAVDVSGGLQTQGNAARISGPTGVAGFGAGFVSGADQSDFSLNLTISGLAGAGSFTVTDVDGDHITGDISGTWMTIGSSSIFNGLLSNVVFHSDADGVFEGTDGGSWTMAGLGGSYDGAIIQLTTIASGFTQDFTAVSTNIDGQVIQTVPIPSSAVIGLAGLGLACLGRVAIRKR
jgi:hypothetical protein